MKKPYFRGAACLATAPIMPIGTFRYLEGLLEFLPFEVKMRFISIQIGGSSLVERQLAPSSCHTQGQGWGVGAVPVRQGADFVFLGNSCI